MAKLYVTEYSNVYYVKGRQMPAPQEPAVATQVIDFTAGATLSAAFNASTTLVRLAPDTACYLIFGSATTTVAVSASSPPLAAGATEFRALSASGLYLSVIQ